MNREEFIKQWDEAKQYVREGNGCLVIEMEYGDSIYANDYSSRPNSPYVLLMFDKYLVAEISYSRIKRVLDSDKTEVIKYNKGSD